MNPLASVSEATKHNTTWALVGSSIASWLIDHSSLITAVVGVATLIWILLGWIERGQRIFFNWKYGPNAKTGDDQ